MSNIFNPSSARIASGIVFPVGPNNGDWFYRTDRQISYEYNSALGKWLSLDIKSLTLANGDIAAQPVTASSALRCPNPCFGLYDIYIERLILAYFISVGASATNYFVTQLRSRNPDTNLGAVLSTQNLALTTWGALTANINTLVLSTTPVLEAQFTETGVSTTYLNPCITYREVG